MISGFSNERVSYRTRYLNFPSTLTENVPSISKPTVHVIKIRFNNIFKNEKVMFAVISVSLSVISLLIGLGMYSMYRNVTTEEMIEAPQTVAMEELQSISAEDAGITVMNKAGMPAGMSGSQQGGNFFAYNNGGGIDPNSMLLASGNKKEGNPTGKEVLTTKRAVVDIDDKVAVNPFLPTDEINKRVTKKVVKPNPNFILPPSASDVSEGARLLLQTSVSGIMYDAYSPSAIVKIFNTDYLVKKGDSILGYKILNITPKTVVIKRDANIYNAPIGRILATLDTVNNNEISHLNTRFGGSNVNSRR